MRWTVFCRVVDNFGDIGFAWRLAADLARRGETVRLAIDDAAALAWMAPRGAERVEVVTWLDGAVAPAEAWVETFGCGLPDASADGVAEPVRVNVEHLTAEAFATRSHGLLSPRIGARGEPQPTWFFYPGFGPGSGGLVREHGLLEQRAQFGDGRLWLQRLGIERRPSERCASLFCYADSPVDALLDMLADAPTLLLLTPGVAASHAAALLGSRLQRGELRAVLLPPLEQGDFDRLLWSCDLNLVRGEDSLVRALWAGSPFIWQLYRQDDGAQAAKLTAFMDLFLQGVPPALGALRSMFAAWNGLAAPAAFASAWASVDLAAWAEHCHRFRERCASHPDLSSALLEFVASKR